MPTKSAFVPLTTARPVSQRSQPLLTAGFHRPDTHGPAGEDTATVRLRLCRAKSSMQGMETTRVPMPSPAGRSRAFSAISTSETRLGDQDGPDVLPFGLVGPGNLGPLFRQVFCSCAQAGSGKGPYGSEDSHGRCFLAVSTRFRTPRAVSTRIGAGRSEPQRCWVSRGLIAKCSNRLVRRGVFAQARCCRCVITEYGPVLHSTAARRIRQGGRLVG